jgi:taurine dehydrogenase small subunit
MTSPTMMAERLRQFGAAWARADLDALMGFVTDDCIYLASVGPEPGTTYRGREEVRRGFAAMLAHDHGRERHAGTVVVVGERGFAEWSFTETTTNGGRRLIRGCDLFQFRDGQISKKDAYRKLLGTVPGTGAAQEGDEVTNTSTAMTSGSQVTAVSAARPRRPATISSGGWRTRPTRPTCGRPLRPARSTSCWSTVAPGAATTRRTCLARSVCR